MNLCPDSGNALTWEDRIPDSLKYDLVTILNGSVVIESVSYLQQGLGQGDVPVWGCRGLRQKGVVPG